MDLPLYNITNHKNAQTNITKNYQWGERNTDLAPNKRTNQNTVHSTNKVIQILLRTNNCAGGGRNTEFSQ